MRQHSFPLMLFAAGFGTRMGALTAQRPKPLIPVAGQSLLDRALALADEAQAQPIVVNVHYLADQIRAHLSGRNIAISDESGQILETGGGLRAALPLLGNAETVMTLNPDVVWKGPNPLDHLAAHWDPAQMDALLLVRPRANLPGRKGNADFVMAGSAQVSPITRAQSPEGVVYLGAQLVKTEGLNPIKDTAFSLNILWNKMIESGKLYALIYPGDWCDVGSPEGLAEAETILAQA